MSKRDKRYYLILSEVREDKRDAATSGGDACAGGGYGASSHCVYTTVRVAIVVDLYKGNGGGQTR